MIVEEQKCQNNLSVEQADLMEMSAEGAAGGALLRWDGVDIWAGNRSENLENEKPLKITIKPCEVQRFRRSSASSFPVGSSLAALLPPGGQKDQLQLHVYHFLELKMAAEFLSHFR